MATLTTTEIELIDITQLNAKTVTSRGVLSVCPTPESKFKTVVHPLQRLDLERHSLFSKLIGLIGLNRRIPSCCSLQMWLNPKRSELSRPITVPDVHVFGGAVQATVSTEKHKPGLPFQQQSSELIAQFEILHFGSPCSLSVVL